MQKGLLRNVEIPFFSSTVSCGFPSPAEDYIETPLDLNELLITKPAATFFVRAKGDSMIGAGIFDGDLLIIDRSATVTNKQVILAVVNGEFTLKRFSRSGASVFLIAENPKYKPTKINEDMDFKVWGMATTCIHKLT
jgi:DNA polymerase V